MSDSRLRDLERRWRQTGAIDDEAAYLRERMNIGDLTEKQIQLAAICLHGAARLITAMEPRPTAKNPLMWLIDVEGHSREAAWRVAITCSAEVIQLHEQSRFRAARPSPKRVVKACATFVLDPSAVMRRQIEVANRAAQTETRGLRADGALVQNEQDQAVLAAQRTIVGAADFLLGQHRPASPYSHFVQLAVMAVGEETIDAAIKRDLIAWALGNDPLPALLARLRAEDAE